MADVVKKTTKTLTLKNPSSSSLSKIIKEKLDIDVNNLKGSDIPKLFKKGLKFKGLLGKKVIDSIGNYLKKNPSTKKQYEKFLPDNLKKIVKDKKIIKDKKKVNKLPVTTINKKDKKINIGEILKNKKQNKNLITKPTNQNKNTGTNITKRVIEGEVLQGIKPPQGGGSKPQSQTVDGKFRNITDKPKRIGGSQNKINTQGLKRRQFLAVDKEFPKMKPKPVFAPELDKKIKPPKDDFTPKIKKPDSPKVKKEELPKVPIKKKSRSNIVQKGGKPSSSYDAQFTYDQLKKRGLKPKGFMSPENYAKVTKKSSGGLIASLYDKPTKTEKYKGNTTSARQVRGYGKARRP